MLHAERARDEKAVVAGYFVPDEWEEYESEIEVEVPIPAKGGAGGR